MTAKKLVSLMVAVVLCLTLMPVGLVRAQEEPVLTVGDYSVPFLYRDGYYVASATVTPEVKKFTAGGGTLPAHEQEISVAGERLLVVNYHDGTFNYKLLPLKSDGVVLEDVKLIRYPDGAVPAGTEVTFYVYTPRRDVSKVVLTLTDRGLSDDQAPTSGKPKAVKDIELTKVAESNDGFYDVWSYKFTPEEVTWYQYVAYAYDGSKKRQVGEGRLTVYDPDFTTPDWLKNAVIYQIFPDRFKNGNPENDVTEEGQKFTFHDDYFDEDFTLPGDYLGQLIQGANWADPVTSWATVTMTDGSKKCGYVDSYRFYGGDLEGIIEELDYLKSLGITAIYLNPIFPSETTHRYDPASYFGVDPRLGDAETFKKLTEEAAKRGIKIINDITPDHSGDDSLYFDVKGAYSTVGAHESQESPFFDWYTFTEWPDKWQGWAGFSAMPIINVLNPKVQEFFLTGEKNVMKYWHELGSSGWRVDVAMQVPMGFTRQMRKALKALSPDNVMIAEVWDHYDQVIPMVLGDSFDSAMNYRVRSLLIGDWDNDHAGTNPKFQGFFLKKEMTQEDFWQNYLQMKNDYPREAFYAMMNLVDSHDAARPLYYLTNTWDDKAKDALKALSFFLYTIPGAPTTFYGDEAGATNEGEFGCNKDRPITDDPFMRVPFPWGKEDTNLQEWYKNLGAVRNEYSFLRTGEIQPLVVEDSDRVIAYLRYDENGTALALFNGSDETATVSVDVGYYFKEDAALKGVIGEDMKLEGGILTLTLKPFETRLAVTTDSVSKANQIDLKGAVDGQKVTLTFTGNAVVEKRDLTTGEVTTLEAKDGLEDVARAGHKYIYTVSVLEDGLKVAEGTYTAEIAGQEEIEPPIVAEEEEEPEVPAAVLTPVVIEDPEGDDYGPGYYTYPTDPVFKDGDFDLLKFELGLYEGSYTATYTVGNLDNAWGSDNGLSKATYFLFIDNKADEGTTQGIEGLNISFAENFKWDVALQIEGWESKVYKVSSGEINAANATDLGVEIKGTEGAPGQVVVYIPKDVVGELTAESKIMVMVAGQDGYGVNRIRQVTPEAQQWRFGGGNEEGTAPAVIDMIVPEGMKQEEILDYKTKAVAIPGVSLKPWIQVPSVAVLTPVVIEDPEGDDYGPGYYTYPTDPVFKDGDFDLLKFELGLYEGSYTATYTLGNLDDAWGSTIGLSKATYFLFIDNKADEGTTQGIEGLNISFAENFKWDVALQIEGWESKVYKVSSGEINAANAADLGVEIKGTEGAPGQVIVYIPKDVVGELTAESKIMVMVAGQDGYGVNRIRQVTPEAQQWRFGGGNEEGTAPAVIDMIVPEGMKQEEILDYKTKAVAIPGVSLKPFFFTEGEERLTILTPQDNTVVNTMQVDITVKVLDANLKKVIIGEKAFDVTEGENVLTGVALPNEGENLIEITDEAGRVLASVKVIRDTVAPQIEILSPKEKDLLTERLVAVTGKTEPRVKVQLELLAPGNLAADPVITNADAEGNVKVDAAFRAFVGLNIMKVTVTDSAGNSSVTYRLFAYDRPHTAVLTIGSKQMDVNVDTYEMDVAPYIKNDYTMVPLRFVAEAFGAKVGWDDATRTATIDFAGHSIKVAIGSSEAVVDGETVTMSLPAEIVNSRTMVPVRFISEAFGFTVKWDGQARTVTITYP